MSDDSKGGSNEPSMEEILASIRRIIAEDAEQDGKSATGDAPPRHSESQEESTAPHWPEDREAEPDPAPFAERTPLPDEGEEGEPLELTQLVNDDGSITDLSEAGAPATPPVVEGVVEREATEQEPRRYETSQAVVQTHDEASPGEEGRDEDDRAEADIEDAGLDEDFAATVVATTATVREEDTEEAEAAALAESEVRAWLDRNLPDIVERVVREEVEKMLRRLKDG